MKLINALPHRRVGDGATRFAAAVTLLFMLLALWSVTHRYAGLERDARVYAFQALARLQPALASDLYLQNTSQDRFTVFSPFYAVAIRRAGLENAALGLTVLFTVWLFAAAWALARRFAGHDLAWVSVALLILTTGDYGAYQVFHFPDPYLTARLPACALIVSALALHTGGRPVWAFALAAAALAVHPIMALPGVLLLLCLSVAVRTSAIGAIAGLGVTAAVALLAAAEPAVARYVTVMDPAWVTVVRERSQFLFLQLWTLSDWELNARAFLSLGLTALVLSHAGERRLCVGALLLGVSGLIVALVGGKIGPIALLVQGQAWRWEWLTGFIALLMLPPTVLRIWRQETGPLCSVLMLLSWTFSAVDGWIFAALAIGLWTLRKHISGVSDRHLRWAAAALMIGVIAWIAATSWNIAFSAAAESGREPVLLTKIRNILGLQISAALLFGLFWYFTITRRSTAPLWIVAVLFAGVAAAAFRKSVEQLQPLDSAAYQAEFADWRAVIPPLSTVFVAPAQDTGTFVWFSLQRPNYLSVDQSAGVVFSRDTALEVVRRSQVLAPVEKPNWRLLSGLAAARGGPAGKSGIVTPLTAQSLASLCADDKLGFVMSKENVGFPALKHPARGKWQDWLLYDCRQVRSARPPA
ncbi:MAG: hypothetical protein NVSMB10_00910 [Steroidobacteraceae bacterium]